MRRLLPLVLVAALVACNPHQPSSPFPTEASTGVVGSLTTWTGSLDSRDLTLPTEKVQGVTCKVFEGYRVRLDGTAFQALDPCIILRNDSFESVGPIGDGGALVQSWTDNTIIVLSSEFHAAYRRGLQADNANVIVSRSRFIDTGESAVEKNDRNEASNLVVLDSYIRSDPGWPCSTHVDGIQVGGAKDVTINHNTVLIAPGGTDANHSCVSNSALGLWSELGDVHSFSVDSNLIGGGGRTMYLDQSGGFHIGAAKVTNNTFYTGPGFGSCAAVWSQLYPGHPPAVEWSGNVFDDGRPLSETQALTDC